MVKLNKQIIIEPRPYLLLNRIQNYEWGSRGQEAVIPKLLGIKAEEGKPYAELWIGAHPKAPSIVKIGDREIPLDELIKSNPEDILGKGNSKKFEGRLPFLLKVLSASEALSIQAHPDKDSAKILHSKDPENYPDENHKPEIAIALDHLEALVGFRPKNEFLSKIENIKGIKDFLGNNSLIDAKKKSEKSDFGSNDNDIVKVIYETMMKKSVTEPDKLKESIEKIKIDLLLKDNDLLSKEEKLFLELEKKYGADVGLFSVFLFNHIQLKEGEGIFLKAGIPHAYLKGNIIECMANSDNVVRVGLTPKFKDIDSLLDILSYDLTPVEVLKGNSDSCETAYKVPINEFEILRWKFSSQAEKEIVNHSASIILVIAGQVEIKFNSNREVYKKGESVLIPAILNKFNLRFSEDSLVFKVSVP